MPCTVKVRYFASLREQAGITSEDIQTQAKNPRELYEELSQRYGFTLKESLLKISLNREYQSFDAPLHDGDELVFIPPVSGG